jgi:NAD(P)-dependent dehydrogenase (short-subunit alcohol dehydrogenase family)
MRVYGQSKLANILFTLELSRRFEGRVLTANSLHPGTVRTGYGGDGDAGGLLGFGIKIASPFFLSAAKGARTSVYLASSPEVEGVSGEYFVKCKPRRPRRWAQDADAAQRLWQVSEELVGLAPAGTA